jgi:hypothetical protein
VHGLHRMYNGHGNLFRHTRWYFLLTLVEGKLILVRLKIVLILRQDRCLVCAKCTIGSDMNLDTPDGTPRWRRSSGRSFQTI